MQKSQCILNEKAKSLILKEKKSLISRTLYSVFGGPTEFQFSLLKRGVGHSLGTFTGKQLTPAKPEKIAVGSELVFGAPNLVFTPPGLFLSGISVRKMRHLGKLALWCKWCEPYCGHVLECRFFRVIFSRQKRRIPPLGGTDALFRRCLFVSEFSMLNLIRSNRGIQIPSVESVPKRLVNPKP